VAEQDRELYARIERITDIARGFQGAVVLAAAAELKLFTLLDRQSLSAGQVAEKLGLDRRAADIFLHALAGMDLLRKESGRFSNSPLAGELLVRGKPYYQGDIILHNSNLIQRWLHLPEVLKTGKPADLPRAVDDSRLRRNFILGMSNIAVFSAQKVAESIDLPGFRRMLDLGGGPGTYAITFCRLNPQLEAVVFDLPAVIDEITRSQVEASGMKDRIELLKGDYLKDDLGEGYDLVLVSNIIHSLGARENIFLIQRCFDSMVSGGKILVKDFLLEEDRTGPAQASMFAVNMLTGTSSGGCYTAREVKEWLESAGFHQEGVVEISPSSRMVVGVKG